MKPVFLLFILFFLLAIFASFIPYFGVDVMISTSIQSLHPSWLEPLMATVSLFGNYKFLPLLISVCFSVLYLLRLKLAAVFSLFSILTSLATNSLIKEIVNRPRPTSNVVHVYSYLPDNSFPSGHTMVYTVIFGFLLYLSMTTSRNTFIKYTLFTLFSFLILTIGVSRVYLGAHWTSDVLGGYLLGGFILYYIIFYYRRFQIIQS